MLNRTEADKLLNKYITDPYHLLHGRMVATAMEQCALKTNNDPEVYYLTGLLHDIDFGSQYDVNQHGILVKELLKDVDLPTEIIYAIQAHAHDRSGVLPQSHLDYALIACDEACGLIYAYSAIRPDKFKNLKAKSLLKVFRNSNFAAKIDRNEIMLGVTGLPSTIEEHMAFLAEVFSDFEVMNHQ